MKCPNVYEFTNTENIIFLQFYTLVGEFKMNLISWKRNKSQYTVFQ